MKLTWETVVIVLGIMAGAVTMAFIGQDPAIIFGAAATILGLFNLNKSTEIKTNVNGNMSALLAELASYRHTLADVAKSTVPMPATVPAVPAAIAATVAAVAASSAAATVAAEAAEGQAAA